MIEHFIYACIALVFLFWLNHFWAKCIKLEKDLHIQKIKTNIERGRAVYWYRSYVFKVHPEKYKDLPTYKEMAESDKELEFID